MYSHKYNLVIGFHGCDKSILEKVILNKEPLLKSKNDYDWLGNGIYFWENNYLQALNYVKGLQNLKRSQKPMIKDPVVIGAILDLGYCLDFLNNENLEMLKEGYETLIESHSMQGMEIPQNKPLRQSEDLLLRHLDCAVIETIHTYNKDTGGKPFDSVRGVFFEGKEVYPNSGFRAKNHIQICIRNPNCIKGYFIPREKDESYPVP